MYIIRINSPHNLTLLSGLVYSKDGADLVCVETGCISESKLTPIISYTIRRGDDQVKPTHKTLGWRQVDTWIDLKTSGMVSKGQTSVGIWYEGNA